MLNPELRFNQLRWLLTTYTSSYEIPVWQSILM